jgi:hypothetical protein
MVWERIETIRRQEENKKQVTSNSKSFEQEVESARQLSEAKWKREREEKHNACMKILEESGALLIIKEIDRGLEDKVRKHVIVEDDNGVKLVWGKSFDISEHGSICAEKGFLKQKDVDYSYIGVCAFLYDQSVHIYGDNRTEHSEVLSEIWQNKNNKIHMENLLAKAFLNPHVVNKDTPSDHGEYPPRVQI